MRYNARNRDLLKQTLLCKDSELGRRIRVTTMRTVSLATLFISLVSQDLLSQIGGETLLYLVSFIVSLLILTAIFYIAGILVVGKERATLGDAFVISLLGSAVSSICSIFFSPLIGLILSLIVWLLLIRHYYETGFLGALAVSILAVIVFIVVAFLLSFLLAVPLVLLRWLEFIPAF